DQSERLALIVRNLLRFARRSATNAYSQVKVNEIIAQTLDLVERQMVTDNIEIVFDRTTDLPKILGNPGELQQVFLNMMLNAYQAMKQSGGRLEIVSHANKENVEVIFSDNGPGIPKEQLTHIFEPFYTTKAEGEGSGLGLSVSYGIVQAHGGRIDVESEVGSGTSFILTLPVAKAAKAA
ncbi:MAG: ATP-binding protein, partial [Armatimonadota bacterium]|nr:ATP-binding protein [Armatimonadota bacterium]